MLFHVLFLVSLICIGYAESSVPSQVWCRSDEQQALLEVRNAFGGGPPFDSWQDSRSCCTWQGIECSTTKDDDDSRRFTQMANGYRVRVVSLPGLQLSGWLPPSISLLRGLDGLDLSNNAVSGSIPGEISTLPRLKFLDLSLNNLSGVLPAFRDGFTGLLRLNLSYNLLEGPIPDMSGAKALQSVDFSSNLFSGELPSRMPCIQSVNVSDNELTGSALEPFRHCRGEIQALVAGINNFSSPLESGLGFFTNSSGSLEVLDLSNNQIPGRIPEAVGLLSALQVLDLSSNRLVGEVPSSLSECTCLRSLNLQKNALAGNLSEIEFSKLPDLVEVDLSFNQLTGEVPAGISSCRNLTNLALGRNRLSGSIPTTIGLLKKLQVLSLSGNDLTGVVPVESLAECDSLIVLVLSKNRFREELPQSNVTTVFKSLQLLAVGNAGLRGEIPDWIGNCRKLQVLDLSWNNLVGSIPPWIGGLEHLFYLDLSNNSLHGEIPKQVLEMKSLRFGGSPSGDLQDVANTLFVKHKSNASALQYRQVSAFPPSIILSSNRLSGEIPDGFAHLKKLVCLDVSNNKLVGKIPASLSGAVDLETLDLSSNNLTGRIPTSLVELTFLGAFNVSFNRLSGPIPGKNQFMSFNNFSYIGNSDLCGPPLSASCLSKEANLSSPRKGPRGVNRGAIMGITIGISLGLTALFAAMIMLSFSKRSSRKFFRHEDLGQPDFKEMSLAQMMGLKVTMFDDLHSCITVGDLIKATDNFDASNIIGCGGFGLVFKARLPGGKLVAIKRLSGDDGGPQMEKEFDAELSTLGNITHENLVPLVGYCRLGMRDRLLVYSYMENGSLDYWLHERSDGGSRLTWRHRLAILRETARGVEYLHRSCDPHIIHRDIKSSNILLDGEFRAHVADFGLARLILPCDTHVTTELVGTLGYIPPEYAQSSVATLRGDVYSFGVVILEVLSRRRPVDACRRGGVRDLVPWVKAMQASGRGIEIIDQLLLPNGYQSCSPYEGGGNDVEEMTRVLDVACYCVDTCPQRRPGIEEVVAWLDAVATGRRKK